FQVKHSPIWLYPTYEHQKPHLLKPEYASQVTPVESGWHPQSVTINSCAEITATRAVDREAQIALLGSHHIWNERMIAERLQWKPSNPLIILLLRVYRLPQPQIIPYSPSYGGCKSWIDLVEPISGSQLQPVLEHEEYLTEVNRIEALIDAA
ncbi:MAG: DUF1802 family protein, partial [Cyanobacteria bacterium J06623_7]